VKTHLKSIFLDLRTKQKILLNAHIPKPAVGSPFGHG
jgi:hypothetical protein